MLPSSPPVPPTPTDEAARLAALARYDAVDAEAAAVYQRLARTAALIAQVPIAAVTFVGEHTVYVRGGVGDVFDVPRELSFCTYGVAGRAVFQVEDARRDERFAHYPFVAGPPGFRAYAGAPILAPDGHALGTVCVLDTEPRTFTPAEIEALEALAQSAADALEARRLALAQRRAAAEYRALFHAHPQPMWVFDTDTLRILTVNNAALDTYGYTREEMLALTLRDLRPPSEVAALEGRLATLNGHRAAGGPWLHCRKDGTRFHVNVDSTPVTFRGRAARLVRLTDVSEAVRARAALGQSEALTEASLAALDDIFFVADAAGKMVRWNRKTLEAAGYTAGEFGACRIEDLFEGEHLERAVAAFAEALEAGLGRFDVELVAKGGKRTPYEFTCAALRDASGEAYGVVSVGRDVSRARRAEALRQGKIAVLKSLLNGRPLAEVLEAIARLLEGQLPGARCSVHFYDSAEEVLRHGAAPGLPEAYIRALDGARVGPGVGPCGAAVHASDPVFADDLAADLHRGPYADLALAHGLRACWAAPVADGAGRVAAVVAVHFDEPRVASAHDVEVLGLHVGLAALAIEHHRRQDALLARDRMLRASADALAAVLAADDVADGAARALRALGEAADADRAYLFEHHRDPETGVLLASQRVEWARPEISTQIDNPALQGVEINALIPDWEAIVAAGTVFSGRTATFENPFRALLDEQGIRSFLLVPFYVHGEAWGFIGFNDCRREREWTEAERSTLLVAGSAIGAAYARARGEAAVREATARFEAVSTHAPGVVYECVIDAEGALSLTYVSESKEAAFGTDLTVFCEHPERFFEFIHPEDREAYANSLAEAARTRTGWAWEGRVVTETGAVRWASGASRLIAAELDGSTRWCGLFLDVTQQKEAEAARALSEARYQSLFNAMEEGFCVVELIYDGGGRPVDYRFLEANPAFERHTGLVGVIGKRVTELTERINPFWMEVYDRAARSGETVRAEGESFRRSRWFSVEAHRVGGTDDCPRVAVLFSDVTERKEYERGLIEARRAAEAGRRAAEEASRMKSALLTNMSHEFRTPLTGIIGFAELLLGELEGDCREMAGFIEQSGRRLLATLTGVLDLAELESGTYRLQLQRLALGAVARTEAEAFAVAAARKGVALRIPNGDAHALADPSALRRALQCVLDNAVKFTEAGAVSVEVRPAPGGAEICVADTGVGIAEDALPYVCCEFWQESGGLDRRFEGSGLGLAVADRLVRAMGGRLTIESTKGKGTVVTLWLPAA